MTENKNKQFNKYGYMGAMHIHSIYSDGTGDIDAISKAAKKAGLDWIIITDHNSLDIEEGYYNGVCVIKGEEISPLNNNHYLAIGIKECINSDNPSEFVKEVKNKGGFGFAAHPDEGINKKGLPRKNNYSPIKWTNKSVIPDGIEIWNWFSQWCDNFNDKNIISLIYSYLFRKKLVIEPNSETLKWWDKLNFEKKEIVPAVGGVDAHELRIKDYIIPVKIFSYEKMFKTITNVLTFDEPLPSDYTKRKELILKGLKQGNNIIMNRDVDNIPPEINFIGGTSLKLGNNTYLEIKTNKKSSIKVVHNGKELCNKLTHNLRLLLKEAGKYRVEIKVGNKGFAYTNPIMVY